MSITDIASADVAIRFHGATLPRGLREDANAMSWSTFAATYAPDSGPLRLGDWQCNDAGRRGPQPKRFEATLALGDRIERATATATGPVAALTAMLYEHGVSVETLKFHQLQSGDTTATFIQGTNGSRSEWAMGRSPDPTQSALSALVACANRLYAGRR